MSRFEVDSEAVAAAAALVQASIGTISAETDGMMRHLEALQGSWRGQAATGFSGVVAEWRGASHHVHTALQSIQTALTHTGQQYADVEAAAVRMFAS